MINQSMEQIEGVIRGTFVGGGYIQTKDGQLFIYYESNLHNIQQEVLVRSKRVLATLAGNTVLQIQLKEDNMDWAEAALSQMIT